MYEIELSKNDIKNLLENLPNYPEQSYMYDTFKDTVKARFNFGDYSTTDAKIRYRGFSSNHWNALQKSWQINLPKTDALNGKSDLRFLIPSDKGWVWPYLWNLQSSKLGLTVQEITPVGLTVNKKNMGLYILSEGWDETLLTRNKKNPYHLFADKPIDTRGTAPGSIVLDLFRPENAFQWSERTQPDLPANTFPELSYLLALTANAPDVIFEKNIDNIIDMKSFLNWAALSILSGDNHQNNVENINLFFNPGIGKFEPIPFDLTQNRLGESIDVGGHRILNRVLRIERFRKELENVLRTYVSQFKNLEDDLVFYDQMTKKIMPAIEKDAVKLPTTLEAKASIKQSREIYINNFITIRRMLEGGGLKLSFANEAYPLSEKFDSADFQSFLDINISRTEFLNKNPQFVAGADSRVVILMPGNHAFTKRVIIPKKLKVIIREGAKLIFNSKTSLVSYSPIEARGSSEYPIVFTSFSTSEPWGVFALVNTGEKSIFSYTHFINGKDDTINGVYFSGTLSAHNSNFEFDHGLITKANADDGIHALNAEAIVHDSFFINNYSDSIDYDYVTDNSSIKNNTFEITGDFKENANGDAMDISGSKTSIEDNIIKSCGDKGVSVGEDSDPLIKNNIFVNCSFGVAIKDNSYAKIIHSFFLNNKIGLGLYRKKPTFISGGRVSISDSVLWGNEKDIAKDKYSTIEIENSTMNDNFIWLNEDNVIVTNKITQDNPTLKEAIPSNTVNHEKPDFSKLLPPNILPLFKQ